ncbi:MAG: flavodoxin family protein [Bacteroidales bacterium]|jgi:multimeric flavodoxin WrbA|nr:flavodoxin family protein [Bacteroidales bacterium]
MKVIAINGSPRPKGNTWVALHTAGEILSKEGIDFEIVQIGNKNIHGCIACGLCAKNKDGKCGIIHDDLNRFLPDIQAADGIILGSPVYYSGIAGTMKCFLDRLFYVSGANGNWMRHKIGAAVVAVRRSGGSMTLDSLNHYLTISEMIVPSSNYWNIIHGRLEGEALQDAEGIQIMQVLGSNMAWLLKLKQSGKLMQPPLQEKKIQMNFIR